LKIYNRYFITVAIVLLSTTVILIATGQTSLDIFYSLYVIEALIVTELFVYFNKKSRRVLNIVGVMLFGGFGIVLCLQVLKALLIF
jgi:hypothetical protein